jgi:hypothetical protein
MEHLDRCYTVHGTGGWESCMVIQDRLQEHGLCSLTRWDPDPHHPAEADGESETRWRFFFETNLKPTEALALLGPYGSRYQVQFR